MRGHLPRGDVIMAKTFKLEIVTPDGRTFDGDVESCVLPGREGSFGVLPGHAPFMTVLGPGEAKFISGGKTEYLALSGGFAQVDPSQVTVLAETAELAGQIDVERAKAKAEAKGLELKTTRLAPDQLAMIQGSLIKELIRLKVAGRRGQA
jgi:F-type H+-transporting ATPase subunit epsilon